MSDVTTGETVPARKTPAELLEDLQKLVDRVAAVDQIGTYTSTANVRLRSAQLYIKWDDEVDVLDVATPFVALMLNAPTLIESLCAHFAAYLRLLDRCPDIETIVRQTIELYEARDADEDAIDDVVRDVLASIEAVLEAVPE